MKKNIGYPLYAFMAALLLTANITPGDTTRYNQKKRRFSKKVDTEDDFWKKLLPNNFLRKHFKDANVWKVLPNQHTDLKYFIQLKRDKWQHFITKIHGSDRFHIVKNLIAQRMSGFAQRLAGYNKPDLNPAANFIGGVYATVKHPGQSDRYLHEKYTEKPTAQEAMSKYKYIHNNKKEVEIKYKISGNTLIISDSRDQKIGHLKLEKVNLKKLDTNHSKDSEREDGTLGSKTKAQLNYILKQIKEFKSKNSKWKNNSHRIIKLIEEVLLLDTVSNNTDLEKLDGKTKVQVNGLLKTIKELKSKNPDWDENLDRIIKSIEEAVTGENLYWIKKSKAVTGNNLYWIKKSKELENG